jgi:alkaline phosphatase D
VAHESDESSSDDEADVVEEKVIVHAHEPDGAVQYKKVHTADQITANKPRTVVKNQLQEESQPIDAIKVLLSGVPRARVNPWNLMTAVINALLVLMVADLTLRAPLLYPSNDLSFTRVGYVDDKSARLLLREPKSAQLPVMISYRPVDKETWTSAETIYSTIEEQDFTQPLTLSNLRPSTNYQYSTSNGHSGAFRTAPRVGHLFEDTSRFTFLTSSCIKPRFPYSPFQHPLRIPGLEHLSSIASKLQASFMLFLGDFIYIDVPQRFGWGADTYRAEYRRVYDSPSWKGASKELPWLHVIDDHEIANDWDKGSQEPYPAAIDPFSLYHHSVNPPPLSENATYYSFKQGPASFFMIDSRRYRSDEFALPADHPEKTMLGKEQLAAVLHWLSQPEPHGVNWKIFVSSIPFTRNWRVNAQDTWAGYLAERQTILEAMWDATSSSRGYGIIILSGDRHEFAATRFPAPPENEQLELARVFGTGEQRWLANAAAYEFSVSPASMFYLPVRSYWENTGEQSGVRAGGEDQVIAYLPDGNSKFGAVEIENTVGSKQSVLRYRLFVDGEESWSYVVTSGGEKGAAGKEAIWN